MTRKKEHFFTPDTLKESFKPVKVYIVVQEIGKVPFMEMVNEWMGKDYVCIGGCDCKSISANPNGWIFTQAMIKG